MFDSDTPTCITVVVISLYLLQDSMKETTLCRWLSPLHVGWIISSLFFVNPFIQKGSKLAIGVGYFLMGALILNTLILGALSILPNHFVSFKSQNLETVGLLFVTFLVTGLIVLAKKGSSILWTFIRSQLKSPSYNLSISV